MEMITNPKSCLEYVLFLQRDAVVVDVGANIGQLHWLCSGVPPMVMFIV